jgi:hypothetical protein
MGLIPGLMFCFEFDILSDGVKCARGSAFKGLVWMAVGGYRIANAHFRMFHWADFQKHQRACTTGS